MKNPLHVVVLAAGRGKRMHSDIAKVLHPIGGRAMLEHVLGTVLELASNQSPSWVLEAVHVVRGFSGDAVKAAIEASGLESALSKQGVELFWHEQTEQRGTGHALMQAQGALPSSGHSLILLAMYRLSKQKSHRDDRATFSRRPCKRGPKRYSERDDRRAQRLRTDYARSRKR